MKLTEEQYYTAPSDDIFNDIKQAAIQLWSTYDDSYGYATGKIQKIKDLENYKDNYAVMVAMFDTPNQFKLMSYVKLYESVELISKLIN